MCKSQPNLLNSACKAARTTVDGFDANHNGILNEHAFNATEGYIGWDQDTLEQLCYWYYGVPRLWGTAENVKKCLVDICRCPNYGIIC
jgi:hypothetical protein